MPTVMKSSAKSRLNSILFFKQKTAYEMRISDWSSDVCSSDLPMSSFPRKREPSAFARTGPESGKSLGSRFRGNDDQGRSSKSRTRVQNPTPKPPAPLPHPPNPKTPTAPHPQPPHTPHPPHHQPPTHLPPTATTNNTPHKTTHISP